MIRDLENKSLTGRNSFGVQASCRQLIEYETNEDLHTIFADMICRCEKWMVLSGGNNVLFTEDYDGVLLHPASDGIEITSQTPDHTLVRVQAGVEWDDFVAWCAEHELWGAENLSLMEKRAVFENSSHFNPVDLVCAVKSYTGDKFDLTQFVDHNTGFISKKSMEGRDLKALELPGLWNGAMSRWTTIFVEVPAETFNPVKTVNDLLRPAHQG